MKLLINSLLLTGLLCSCGTARKAAVVREPDTQAAAASSIQLLSGTWVLTYIQGTDKEFDQLYKGKKPSVNFDITEQKISGNTSCNSFSGSFKASGKNSLDLKGPMMMTKMFCEGGGEEAFMAALRKVTSYAGDGTTLDLIAGDIGILQFRRK